MISPVHRWTAEKTGLGDDLSPVTLQQWQSEKLKKAVDHARTHSRFYRERLRDFDDLSDLPFTSPSDLANDPSAFMAVPQDRVARVSTLANSGTTHLKKRILFSESDLERTKDFFAAGMSSIVSKGDHAVILISNRTENSLGTLLGESLSGIGVTADIPGVIRSAAMAIEDSVGADCLVGMPAEIFYMCRTEPSLRPKSVLLAADIAPQSVIRSISETWKCKVFTHYGHTEFGYGCAVDCGEHDGLHLRDADLIFEIIDPLTSKNACQGESGEIVITTLSNEAMPLIRYRTGNISSLVNSSCRCGSSLSRLSRIEGRYNNLTDAVRGNTLSIYRLDEVIYANSSVRGYNMVYEPARETLHLAVDASAGIDISGIEQILPGGIRIDIKYDAADPFVQRGKRRIQVC